GLGYRAAAVGSREPTSRRRADRLDPARDGRPANGCARSVQLRTTPSRDPARVLLRRRFVQVRRERHCEGPPPSRGADFLLTSSQRPAAQRALPERRAPVAARESRRQYLSLRKLETRPA